jgi:hypothetical protein
MKIARVLALIGLVATLGPCMVAQAPTPAPLPVDQQATKEQITKLFEVMRLRQTMDSLMKSLPAMMQQQIEVQSKQMMQKLAGGQSIPPEEIESIKKVAQKFMDKALSVYPVEEMIADSIAVYQRHVSRDDADALIAFYSSPVGQRLLDAQPAIMQEYMPMVMNRVQERTKVLTDEMAKEMQEMMKSASSEPAKN